MYTLGEETSACKSQSNENDLESATSPTPKRKSWYHRIKPKGRQESRSILQKDSHSNLKKHEGTFHEQCIMLYLFHKC